MAAMNSGQPSPANQRTPDAQQCFVDVIAYLPANPQATEPIQIRKRALHDPPLGTQSRAVLGAPPGNHRLHPESADEAAVLVVIVTTIAEHNVGTASGRPRLPRTAGTSPSPMSSMPLSCGSIGVDRLVMAGCSFAEAPPLALGPVRGVTGSRGGSGGSWSCAFYQGVLPRRA